MAYGVDVRVAEVVDDVWEQLDELAPKRGLLFVRQDIDPCSSMRESNFAPPITATSHDGLHPT